MTNPQYRCFVCKNRYKTEQDKREKLKEVMGCSHISSKPKHTYRPEFNNDGNPIINYNNCVGNHFFSTWTSIINYYSKFSSGILAYDGGYMEQPAKFVEVMELVHNLIRENEQTTERKTALVSRNKRNGRR